VLSRVGPLHGLLALITVLLPAREGNRLPGFLVQSGLTIAATNLLAVLSGFIRCRLFRFPPVQLVCIAIEMEIQTGALAIAITTGSLKKSRAGST
jgi:BASS family bile acid:Na+ symporter